MLASAADLSLSCARLLTEVGVHCLSANSACHPFRVGEINSNACTGYAVNGRWCGERCGLPPTSLSASASRLECRLAAGSKAKSQS